MDRLSHRSWRGSGSPARRTVAAAEEEEEKRRRRGTGSRFYGFWIIRMMRMKKREMRGRGRRMGGGGRRRKTDEDEENEPRVAPARRQRHVEVRRDCPYLDTVDRQGKKVDTSQRTNDLPSQWEAEAANAIRDIAALKKEIEQTVQTSNELLDQLESYVGEDIVRFFESSVGEDIFFVHSISGFQWKGVQKYEKLFSEINKSHHAALNGLRQMTGIIEKMPHVLIDKEPVNPSLPDDAEVNAPNNTQ